MPIDDLITYIGNALPASGHKQIAEQVSLASGEPVSIPQVGYALSVLRDNYEEYGWTVHTAKKGPDSPDRFIMLLYDPATSEFFTVDDERRLIVLEGAHSAWADIATRARRFKAQIKAARAYERSRAAKRDCDTFMADLDNIAVKAAIHREAVAEEIAEAYA